MININSQFFTRSIKEEKLNEMLAEDALRVRLFAALTLALIPSSQYEQKAGAFNKFIMLKNSIKGMYPV